MVSRFPSQRSFPRNERTRLWRLSRATRRKPSSTTDRLVALGRALRAAAMSSSSITILVRMMCKTHENIHIVTDTSSPWYTGFRDLTCPSFAIGAWVCRGIGAVGLRVPTRRYALPLVRNCAKRRRADLFRVLRQDPFSVPRLWLFPFSKALCQLCLRNFECNRPFLAVDFDGITILDDRYRPACKRLWSHVPNNKSVTAPGKSPISN